MVEAIVPIMKLPLVILLVFSLIYVSVAMCPSLGGGVWEFSKPIGSMIRKRSAEEYPNFCSANEDCFSGNCNEGVCGSVIINRKRRDIIREITDEILEKLHCAHYSSCGSHLICPFDEFCFRVPAVFP